MKKGVSLLRQAQDDVGIPAPRQSLQELRLRDQCFRGIRRMARRISLAVAAVAGLTLAPKVAKAGTPFDAAINGLGSDPFERETTGAQLVNGPASDRFDMTFAAMNAASTAQSIYRTQLRGEIGADGGVVFRRLGTPVALPSPIDTGGQTFIEYTRPDGREDVVRSPGFDEATGISNASFAMNGRDVWPYAGCGEGSISYIHPSARNPRELKVAVSFPEAFGTEDEDIYRVPIDEANFCTYLHDRILAAIGASEDPCTTGMLQCNAESTWVRDTRAPENEDFEIRAAGSRVDMLKWDSVSNEYDIYMERGADGCYTEEVVMRPPYPAVVPNPEEGLGLPDALLTQPLNLGGRVIYPYVSEAPGANGRPQLEAMAFEMIGGNPCEIPVTMEADDAAVVDDDNDGLNNDVDNCAWVQESAGIDVSGPAGIADSIGDACQTTCTNWPAVSPPAGATSSDFWECAGGTEIEGYDHAYKRGDGSTLLTDHDLALNPDGSVQLPPDGDFYWLHAQAAQFSDPEVASPVFKFSPGNSADIEILSLTHPDGTPGDATFTHLPYPSGPAEVTDPLTVGTHHFDPGLGDALGLSASVVRGHAGTDGWCVECAPGCPDMCPPVPEVCNGIDDNGNGVIDEGCACSAGEGICERSGTIQADGSCDAVPGAPEAMDTCGDGIDNNCLNGIDEDCICAPDATQACYEGDEATRNIGACQDGLQTCTDGRSWSAACEGQVLPAPETCNGIDDDCNGATDEDIAPRACSSVCGDGTEVCRDGAFRDCDAPAPQPEICNGIDDDCDSSTDEGCPCSAGEGACARSGTIQPDGSCDAMPAEEPCGNDGGTGDDGGSDDDAGEGNDDTGGMDDDARVSDNDDGAGDNPGGGCNCAMHGSPERGKSAPFSPEAGLFVAGLALFKRFRRRVTQALER